MEIEENLKGPESHQGGQASHAGLRGKWGLMPRKVLEGSQIPIRPSNAAHPQLRLRDGSETLNNPRSAVMKTVQIVVILRQENCVLLPHFVYAVWNNL